MLSRSLGLGSTTSRVASAALMVASLLACDRPGLSQGVSPAAKTSSYGSSLANLLHERLAAGPRVQIGHEMVDSQPLRRVYEARGYEPIWSGSWRARSDVKLVLDTLNEAEKEGLRPEDYRLAQLSAMRPASDEEKAEHELLMTDSLLRYARDLRSGRVRPADIDEDIDLPELGFDFSGAVATAVAGGTLRGFLTELTPKHREYQALKQALARYRAIDAAGGWSVVPANTKLGGETANMLRARLAAEDQHVAAEENVADALKRYQQRNGLTADGRPGPKTLAALNVPVTARIKQIAANMERWRWMPRELEPRRITINVTEATLQFIDDENSLLDSNVVVGSPKWRTPVLRTEAIAVTVNPVWHVPASIAHKEMWPKQQANPGYLESEGYVVVNGQIRQPPGPGNALGSIKIEMPNDFGVYLHDTPTRSAFSKETRTLSHGCVRVERIAPLASLALSGDAQSALGELSELIAAGKTTRIDLDQRIPVYLLYWTAVAGDDGAVGFRSDVYERDPLLIAALEGARGSPRVMAELDV